MFFFSPIPPPSPSLSQSLFPFLSLLSVEYGARSTEHGAQGKHEVSMEHGARSMEFGTWSTEHGGARRSTEHGARRSTEEHGARSMTMPFLSGKSSRPYDYERCSYDIAKKTALHTIKTATIYAARHRHIPSILTHWRGGWHST